MKKLNLDKFEVFAEKNSYTKFSEDVLFSIFNLKAQGWNNNYIANQLWKSAITIQRLFYPQKKIDEIRAKKFEEKRTYQDRKEYNNKWNKESEKWQKYLERKKKKVRVWNMIKNEVCQNPTTISKSLWDWQGRWSMRNDACVECNSNMYKHDWWWLCVPCYRKHKRENLNEEEKAKIKEVKKKYSQSKKWKVVRKEYDRNLRGTIKIIKDWIKTGKIEKTYKITNLLTLID